MKILLRPALTVLLAGLPPTLAALAANPTSQAAGETTPSEITVAAAATTSPPTPAPFVELANSGIEFSHFNGMSGGWHMAEINSGGGTLFDYDNDGDLDVYLVQGALLPPGKTRAEARLPPAELPHDRLYRNDLRITADGQRHLHFTEVTAASGIHATGYGFAAATGDYDNDGFVDLYVTHLGSNLLLHNNGDGTFEDRTKISGTDDDRWSISAVFADFDGDGWLDLFVSNFVDGEIGKPKTCRTANGTRDYCGPNAYKGVGDRLLRNQGDGTFADITLVAGLHKVRSKALGVVVADFDGDGRLDLYVANDGVANQMWLQREGGRFVDEALFAGSAVNLKGRPEASMGVDASDFDGDGDDDLFMTHLVHETNTLYLNDGQGNFLDGTIRSGLGPPSLPYTSWGTAFFDYDNDGWLDLLVANGAVRVIERLAAAGDPYPFHQRNQLFGNQGDGRFTDLTATAGPAFERSEVSRALAFGDLDNDGDTDALLVNNNGPARVLLNAIGQDNHWLGLRLLTRGGRDALGARVEILRPEQQPMWRRVRADGSFAAANDPRVLIGLGQDKRVDAVRVHWLSGQVEQWQGLPIDRYTALVEGSGRSIP